MSSQLSVKLAPGVHPQNKPGSARLHGKQQLFRWLRMWKQVLLAELWNLLEGGRYDLRR